MPSKHRLEFIIPLFIGVFFLCVKCVHAEEEDDPGLSEIITEIIIDLFVGFMIGQCQQNPTCNYWLTAFVIVFTVVAIVGWCISGCHVENVKLRNVRRAGTVYAGSRLAYGVYR
jgi:hypothetical protein